MPSHYESTKPMPNVEFTGDEYQDMNPKEIKSTGNQYLSQIGGAFDTHHHALQTVLSLPSADHHFLSHTADVLAEIIESHHTKDHHQLGHLVRDVLAKKGIVVTRGGSFWSWIGHGVSKAWNATKKFVGDHAKDIGKIALDAAGAVGSAAATALGNPELIPAIEGATQLGKKAIGGAIPLTHMVGALKDVSQAHCPQSKATLLHKDFLLTGSGSQPSPVLAAMHFAHQAMPHVKEAMGGNFWDSLAKPWKKTGHNIKEAFTF